MSMKHDDGKTGDADAGSAEHHSAVGDGPPTDATVPPPYRPLHPPLWNNFLTLLGLFLAVVGVLGLLTFGLFTLVSPATNPYVDIVGYLVVPGILVAGALAIVLGILLRSWKVHRRDPQERVTFIFPHIDLGDPRQRRAAQLVVGGIAVLLPVVGVSSYHTYHYTDSADFCAKACHSVMEPQATTYEHSAHARVPCASCHIGAGASWFVKAKLSGTRQVIATWRDTYPRPIPPAITELRPARETCEQCHWPKKFFGAQLKEIARFAANEQNSRRDTNVLLKTGGGDETTGRAEGIHLHMALAAPIEYIATDDKLQDIPWVQMATRTGEVLVYRSDGRPSSDPRPEGQVRRVDCMDCHNRPAHKFLSPSDAVDLFLETGHIDTTLPFIKREAVAALIRPYADVPTAESQIGAVLIDFYREHYPDLWRTRQASVNSAIDAVREIYRRNFFPTMKVDWQTYPDNIGHKASAGCFRCHDGRHVDQHGVAISHACDVCHTFLNPIAEEGRPDSFQRGEFVHSFKLEGPHAGLRCDACHASGTAPDPSCTGCHARTAAFRAGTLADFAALTLPAEPMADSVDCADCHDLSKATDAQTINARCVDCHSEEEYADKLAEWTREVDELIRQAETQADAEGRRLLAVLRQAGPVHNLEATRIITRAVASRPAAEAR